jgi:hypothetical protein
MGEITYRLFYETRPYAVTGKLLQKATPTAGPASSRLATDVSGTITPKPHVKLD